MNTFDNKTLVLLVNRTFIPRHNTVECQGTKYKFWTKDGELFKEGKVQGENWAKLIHVKPDYGLLSA